MFVGIRVRFFADEVVGALEVLEDGFPLRPGRQVHGRGPVEQVLDVKGPQPHAFLLFLRVVQELEIYCKRSANPHGFPHHSLKMANSSLVTHATVGTDCIVFV